MQRKSYAGVLIFLIVGMLFAAIALAAEDRTYRGNETPDYVVERAAGDFELRRYPPYMVAEVRVRGGRGAAANGGFRALAGYIFGGNDSRTKMAMTTPVTQSPVPGAGDVWEVRFVMPAGRRPEDLPVPDNAAVRLVREPGGRMVVLRFSGRWQDANLAQKEAALRAWAAAEGLRLAGPPVYAFYDSPFTLPATRRNEVMFRVK